MIKTANRVGTIGFVFAGVAFGVLGLIEGNYSYIVLGISFLSISVSVFYSGRSTAEDGPKGSSTDAAQQTGATDENSADR